MKNWKNVECEMERNYDDYLKVFFKACTSVHVRKKTCLPAAKWNNTHLLTYFYRRQTRKAIIFSFAWVSAPSGVIACTTTSVGETDANKYGYNNFQSTAVTIDNCCATSASSSSRGNSVGSGDDFFITRFVSHVKSFTKWRIASDDNYFRISFIVTCPGQRCV